MNPKRTSRISPQLWMVIACVPIALLTLFFAMNAGGGASASGEAGAVGKVAGAFALLFTGAAGFTIAFFPVIIAGLIAKRRGRNPWAWLFVGGIIMLALALLNPIIGFVAGVLVAVFAAFQRPLY